MGRLGFTVSGGKAWMGLGGDLVGNERGGRVQILPLYQDSQINKNLLKKTMQILADESFRKRSTTITSTSPELIKSTTKIQKAWRRYQQHKALKKRIKKMKSKSQIAKQLLTSQKMYVEHLEFIITHVVIPSRAVIDDKEIHELLFSDLESIYKMHRNFLGSLEAVMADYSHHKTRISTVIYSELFGKQNFKLHYSNYCSNYKKSNEMAKLLFATNSSFSTILRNAQIKQSTALESYLIKPMQRLCKYELLLNNYYKNTECEHIDYLELEKTILYVENLVKETNEEVEEFLMDEKFRDIKYQYQDVLKKINNPNRKLLFSIQDISLIDLINDQSSQLKQLNLFTDTILLLPSTSAKPIFNQITHTRSLPNLKYFKNLVQLIHQDKYLTIEFKKDKHKEQFLQVVKKCDHLGGIGVREFIQVSVLGTEIRSSLFKNYTVYIVQIRFNGKEGKDGKEGKENVRKIYPRFKDMLRIKQLLESKKIKLNLPSLNRQTYFVTNKSKTIQKRKLIIQQHLQKILNCKEIPQSTLIELFKVLNLNIEDNVMKKKIEEEVSINLPSLQVVKVMIDVKNCTVRDLKETVAAVLGLIYCSGFQIYEVKNKMTRLMDQDQPVLQIHENQTGFSFNPFKQSISYIYTRHHYIDPEDEFTLYKNDFMRTQLELSVIKSQILKYRLEEELMITFMCLFAIYTSVPVHDDGKLMAYIKDIGRKEYKVSKEEFRAYFGEVQRKVNQEEDQMVTLPFLIVKIISNSPLYRCRQFQVSIHPKSFKALKTYIPGLEQKIVLGIKNSHALLLTVESKHIVQSFSMDMIHVLELHPTSIILQIQNIGPGLRLDTQNAFQISKLFDIYKKKV